MRLRTALLASALAAAAMPPLAQAAPPPAPVPHLDDVSIRFTKTQLPNGMTVILHEDHTLPLVAVHVAYWVGSRMEQPKRTGFAHLFEHLMFMGTSKAPSFDTWMESAGGWNNATTTEDHTDYYDVAPASALPLLLWLEADRMRDLGPEMTLVKLNLQRSVVRNERRQAFENTPYGLANLRLAELVYPEGHPYHHPVIGSHEDLEAAKVDDVKQFFATWYDPANASLCVAGDLDSKAAIERITQYFATVPSHGKPKDPGAPAVDTDNTTLKSVVRETDEDDVELPKVTMIWQSPKTYAAGDAELGLLGDVLAQGKGSRLYKALVYEQKIAQEVESAQHSGILGSQFEVSAIARPGVSVEKLEQAIDAELAKVRTTAIPKDELARAKNGYETTFVARLESVEQRAAMLNRYQTELGDPGYAPRDLARYRQATPDGVRDTAAKVLDPNARVILRIVPRGNAKNAGAAKGGAK